MKKLFFIAAIAAITLTACNKSKSSDNEILQPDTSSIQDSIDSAHGHSHDPSASEDPVLENANIENSQQQSEQQSIVGQDSIDKAHGHKH